MTPDEKEYLEALAAWRDAVARLLVAKARVPGFVEAQKKQRMREAQRRHAEREKAKPAPSPSPHYLDGVSTRVLDALNRALDYELHRINSLDELRDKVRAAGRDHWAFNGRFGKKSWAELDRLMGSGSW